MLAGSVKGHDTTCIHTSHTYRGCAECTRFIVASLLERKEALSQVTHTYTGTHTYLSVVVFFFLCVLYGSAGE